MNEEIIPAKTTEEKPKSSKRTKIILGIVVALLLCCCGVFAFGMYLNSTPEGQVRLTERAREEIAIQEEKTAIAAVELTEEARPTETATIADTLQPTDTPKPTNTHPTNSLPGYTLFNDNSYEDAGTVKVIWEILVSPDITKESLNALLNELYKDALAKTSGSNDRPIVIDIKAYTSEEHATSGMGQWIGWVSKMGDDTEPSVYFDEGQLNAISETPEMKFGLSEIERKQIWQDIVRAEDKAEKEALQQYPDMQPFDEFQKLEDELVLKYKSELAQATGLTLEQLGEIALEGLTKNWPFPQQ